jgi:hypothetical protein
MVIPKSPRLLKFDQPQTMIETAPTDDHFKKDACFYSLLSLDDGTAGEPGLILPASSRRSQDDWESGQNPESCLAPTAHRDAKVRSGRRSERHAHRSFHWARLPATSLRRGRRRICGGGGGGGGGGRCGSGSAMRLRVGAAIGRCSSRRSTPTTSSSSNARAPPPPAAER